MSRRGQAGFTLLELLVGLALLGLTVAITAAALNTGLLGADVTGKRSARLNQIRAAQTVLRDRLGTARPVAWSAGTRAVVGFDGESESADFIAVLPPWPGQGGPHLVRIARNGDRLTMSTKIHAGGTQAFDFSGPVERTVLLEGVRSVRFAYYGRTAPRAPAGWHPTWRSQASLPSLVRLSVAFAGDVGTAWPELVIAPVIGPQPR